MTNPLGWGYLAQYYGGIEETPEPGGGFGVNAFGWAYYGQAYAPSGAAPSGQTYTDSASGTITLSGSGAETFSVQPLTPIFPFRRRLYPKPARRYEDRMEGRIPLSGYATEYIDPDPELQREAELVLALV